MYFMWPGQWLILHLGLPFYSGLLIVHALNPFRILAMKYWCSYQCISVSINKVSEGFSWISLDSKCSDGGCWYCKNLCHNCMKPAGVGYTKMAEGAVYKHCSEHCKSLHFGDLNEISFQADVDISR